MLLIRLVVMFGVSALANAAALIPVPEFKAVLPMPGLEPNRGQAKPEILFLTRGLTSRAVTGQAIIIAPLGVRQTFVASNPNPAVSYSDPLPGLANSLAGPDPAKWVTRIPRYGSARLAEIYPGIDVQYLVQTDGRLTMRLLLRPGADLKQVVFEVAESVQMVLNANGSLQVRLGPSFRVDPSLFFPAPTAFQESGSGRLDRTARLVVASTTRFSLAVDDADSMLPLGIDLLLDSGGMLPGAERQVADAAGNTFVLVTVPDAGGKDDPFSGDRWAGCGTSIAVPVPCTDAALYKFARTGELSFVTYLAGRTREAGTSLALTSDGSVVVTGNTDSADFPTTSGALQPAYAGPTPSPAESYSEIRGDFFAAKLDSVTGMPRVSTFFGGPQGDSIGETVLAADGSIYFVHKWLGTRSAQMPVSNGALMRDCTGDPCSNAYAAHLSAGLDRLLYGTYLPGNVQATAKVHSDGSLYFAGSAGPGFPTTPGAVQRQPAGNEDAMVGRLDPTGSRLLFATYLGTADSDWILRMAVGPDGSAWVDMSSFVQCCVNIRYRLVRLSANGDRILVDKPIPVDDMVVDQGGNLLALAEGIFPAGPDAFLESACDSFRLAYVKLSPTGEQLFATYLPAGWSYDFDGVSARGLPILRLADERFEIVEGQSMGVFSGCVVDGASFSNYDSLSPGAILTLFGTRMGPRTGVGFTLEDGRLPSSLAGTRVLVNGEPVPLLYVSYSQINAILPYSTTQGTQPVIQVESGGMTGNERRDISLQRAAISIFRLNAGTDSPAAALNEDYSVNTLRNPAKKGSRIMLFGMGGGATVPPSVAGEVTPLEPRPLDFPAKVQIVLGEYLSVEYAGAAPGLVAGVNQINIKLPDQIPQITGYPKGVLPLWVETPGNSRRDLVTVSVQPD